MCKPACAIAASSPAVFSATVFPPVLGPVMTRTRVGVRRMSTGGSRNGVGVMCCQSLSDCRSRSLTCAAHQQRMSSSLQLERSVSGDDRFDGARHQREPRARLDDVQRGGDFDRSLELVRPRAEGIGQREQDALHLLRLLLLERDDVVVDLDGLERLDEQAGAAGGAAVNDAGNRGSMFGANHQHVATVAVGDDLFLQILRGFASAQERIERGPQALFLSAQALADRRERRAGVVGDLAGRLDLPPDVGDLAA